MSVPLISLLNPEFDSRFLLSETTPSVNELSLSGSGGEDALRQFVCAAKDNGVKALVSIGGVSTQRV